jgi:hypothetical protein
VDFCKWSVDISGICGALHTNSLSTAIQFSVKQYTSTTTVLNTICDIKHYVDSDDIKAMRRTPPPTAPEEFSQHQL